MQTTMEKLIAEVEDLRGIVSSDDEDTDVVLAFLREGYEAVGNRRLGEAIDLYAGIAEDWAYEELCRRWDAEQPIFYNFIPAHAMSQVGAQMMAEEKRKREQK